MVTLGLSDKDMHKVWIITDTHFGKDCKLLNRPVNFQKEIIKNWKHLVGKEDTIIHLGDVANSASALNCIKGLPGKKILILGNHDTLNEEAYINKCGFSIVCDKLLLFYKYKDKTIKILFTHEPEIFHDFDVNIHGHLHNFATVKSVCYLYLMALENQGYRPLNLKEEIIPNIYKKLKGDLN